jgi:hypothetical protein
MADHDKHIVDLQRVLEMLIKQRRQLAQSPDPDLDRLAPALERAQQQIEAVRRAIAHEKEIAAELATRARHAMGSTL